jgi:protein phosphatase
VKLACLTDVGLKREHNEDSVFSSSLTIQDNYKPFEFHLCIVADGMGGAAAGEIASDLAVDAVSRVVLSGIVEARSLEEAGYVNSAVLMKEAVEAANRNVRCSARSSVFRAGMGTTCCAGLFGGGLLTIGHVGDSRAYVFRERNLYPITEDHSFVNRLVKEGRLTPEQAAVHPRRNVITRAIGSRDDVEVDIIEYLLKPGDIYLFCSDGLSGMINDNQIAGILEKSTGQAFTDDLLKILCSDLIRGAINGGGKDNITVALAAVEHSDVPPAAFRPLPVRHEAVLTWDHAVDGRFVDDSFVPVGSGKQ